MLGLLLAPLLFGSVNPDGQAVVGVLFAASLLLLGREIGGANGSVSRLTWFAAVVLVLPLLPLPVELVELLSPQRAALDHAFPLELGAPGAWLTLTISPAGSIQRLWELSLVIACFSLARTAAHSEKFPRHLAMVAGLGLGLLAASDVWYRLDGQRSVLGLWHISWGKGAGTFANRNHFADWIYVTLLFSFGWIVRQQFPLQSARAQPLFRDRRFSVGSVLFGLTLAFGLVMAVACGSRGGFLALLAGLAVWMLLLARRSKRRKRWLGIAVVAVVVLGLIWFAGGHLFHRFVDAQPEASARFLKLEIWQQSLQQLFLKFPLFGTGWGSYVTAFNHFKTSGGESTVWHAENEYVQLLVETGLVGAVAFGWLILNLVRRAAQSAWRERLAEPELFFGALAALAGFAVHAGVEFVFQITSTALLAAALLGFLTGSREQVGRPALLPPLPRGRVAFNVLCAFALLAAAVAQGMAYFHAQQANTAKSADVKAAEYGHSLNLWPWATERRIAWARAQASLIARASRDQQARLAESVRGELNSALARDPYQWELRLHRAWFDLTFSTNRIRAVAEAHEAARLNPLQPLIPLGFARQLAARDPDLAWEFLRATDLSSGRHLRDALDLAWQTRGDTVSLRVLTPDTVAGWLALGDFALEKGFAPLAAQSFQRLTNRVESVKLAGKLIEARRPDLAISVLPQPPVTPAAKLMTARAHYETKAYTKAISYAESVWLESPVKSKIIEAASEVPPALRPAEEMFRRPAGKRDLAQLRQWAEQSPGELRLVWLLFQTELERDQFSSAARTAIELASRVAAKK